MRIQRTPFIVAGPNELRFLLPEERASVTTILGGAGLSHGALLLLLLLVLSLRPSSGPPAAGETLPERELVFMLTPGPAGGGGGGGQRSPAPPRRRLDSAVAPVVEPPPLANAMPDPEVQPPAAHAPLEPSSEPLAVLATAPSAGESRGSGDGPGTDTGRGGGNGSGNRDGVGSGDDDGCCLGASGPGSGVVPPELIYKPRPLYTAQAAAQRVRGAAELLCVVNSAGVVTQCEISKSLDGDRFGLDTEAMRAARQFRFRPATLQNRPVSIRIRILIEFNIH